MPGRPARECTYPGCKTLVRDGSGRCVSHPQIAWSRDAPPPERIRGRRLQAMRRQLFRNDPLCVECAKAGRVTLATIRDHVIPLAEGGEDDQDNTQGLCVACHDVKSQVEAARGVKLREY